MTQVTGSNDSGLLRRSVPRSPSARWSERLPALLAAVATQPTAALSASAIAEELVATLGACRAAVHFADGDERTLRLVASCNMPGAPAELFVLDGDGDGGVEPARWAARSRLLFLACDDDQREGTLFAMPLLSGRRLLGAITCELPARLEPRELANLDAMGVVFGALVDRARREDECRARAEWTSLVAHELRQPLSALSMHATVLRGPVSRSHLTSFARRIGEGVMRMTRLIGDLTDVSLVELGKSRLVRLPTNIVALTSNLADGSGHPAGTIRVKAEGRIPDLEIDPARMEQVLSNLFDNARKYSPAGAVVDVWIERGPNEVVISVSNEGPCIDERSQARLFDRYYRADYSRSDGLGIGLYVARGLAEAHGGTISVTSRDGVTTFSLVLPLARGSAVRSSVAGCPAIPRSAAALTT